MTFACGDVFIDAFPYLSIKELLKVGFKRLWEYGREGIVFESFSFAVGETAWFKVVRTNEVERCPQLLWNFQIGFSKKTDFLDEQKLQVFIAASEK